MEIRICRICGKTGEDFFHIFKVDGLVHKIETTLPIIVSPHSLLPDEICKECTEIIEKFYVFMKACLQNLIILESQLDIKESCLKSKRKHDRSCSAKLSWSDTSKFTQTEDYLDILLGKNSELEGLNLNFPLTTTYLKEIGKTNRKNTILVNYEIDSDENSDIEDQLEGKVISGEKLITLNKLNDFVEMILNKKNKFAPQSNLIQEIFQRKDTLKRKRSDAIEQSCPKICKLDIGSRRKCAQPKKLVEASPVSENVLNDKSEDSAVCQKSPQADCESVSEKSDSGAYESSENLCSTNKASEIPKVVNLSQLDKPPSSLRESCLMCDTHFPSPDALAAHIYQTHHIEMSEIVSSGSVESLVERSEKRKKSIPNLVKISDLRRSSIDDSPSTDMQSEDPPSLLPSFVCPNCPAIFISKNDLMLHLRLKHPEHASHLCGLCLYQATTYTNLKNHLRACATKHTITNRYVCKVCCYGDDNFRWLEHHVLVHEFLLDFCRKDCRMFDPADYVEKNEKFVSVNGSPFYRTMSCTECGQGNFETFKDFACHRRSEHSIFHCDLCNKFYGRNSHLWKHVNRLHKGHPSITCQMCYKTSASKYHLAQHFNKIHAVKMPPKNVEIINQKSVTNLDVTNQRAVMNLDNINQKAMNVDLTNQKAINVDIINQKAMINLSVFDENKSSEVDSNSNLNSRPYSDRENEEDEDEGQDDDDTSIDVKLAPKELDSTHDLYTNIITNYTPPLNEGEFKCQKCYKAFHKRVLLRKHKKNCRPRMQKDLLTRCKSCNRIFKDRQSLAKHLVNYHSDYACEMCRQNFQSKCEIVSHIRFQHVGSHLVCHVCQNVLRSRDDLEEHLRIHNDSFICQFCGDSLPSKVKLKMHILSLHRAILSLSCGICLRLFENQHVLRDHVTLMHKDQLDPLTSCPVCGKNYGSKWKTYDHLNKSHGRIFRACKICLEIFNNDTELETHTKTAHVNIPPTNNIKTVNDKPLSMSHVTSTINDVATNTNVNNNNDCDDNSDSDDDENNTGNSDSDSDIEERGNDEINREIKLEKKEAENYEEEEEEIRDRKPLLGPFAAFGQKQNGGSSLFSQENRISLLEKRFVGKILTEVDPAVVRKHANVVALNSKQMNVVHIKKENSMDTVPIIKKEEDSESSPVSVNCNFSSSSKRTVYVNSNDPSKCEICNKTWPAKKHLWQHYIRCHKTVAATVCGICLKSNPDYFSLQIHLRNHHPSLLHGQGFGSNFICRVCGRYHNASSKLKLHMVIHENFDWGILERLPPLPKIAAVKPENHKIKQEVVTNGHSIESLVRNFANHVPSVKKETTTDSDFDQNYLESLIEEEEYFSQDQSEGDRDSEREEVRQSDDCDSSVGQLTVDLGDAREERGSRPEVEQGYTSTSSEDSSNSSSLSDDDEDEGQHVDIEDTTREQDDSLMKSANVKAPDTNGLQQFKPSCNRSVNPFCNNIFRRRPEELDSAVKSISLECLEPALQQEPDDYCDVQTNCLNDNELESAVGSIL